MKFIFILITIFFSNTLFAQLNSPNFFNQNIYVFNNLKDTIHLTRICKWHFCLCDTLKIVDTLQIDGIGSKEIVFYRHCGGIIDEHGGSFDISESYTISKYEIWNLDTKKMLFEAVNYYNCNYNRTRGTLHTKGVESCSYNFNIHGDGQISISNLKTNTKAIRVVWKTVKKWGKSKTIVEDVPYIYDYIPDKTMGIYRYLNGEYVHE